jgi:DNA uptake protein ComE-like DNA-binding protein
MYYGLVFPYGGMKRKLQYFLKLYFGFSRRESRGFLMVFPVLVLLYFIPIIYNRMIKFANQDQYQAYLEQVDLEIGSGKKSSGLMGMDSIAWNGNNTTDQDTLKRDIAGNSGEPEINLVAFSEVDSIVLQVVPGIGQVLAGRIIKYRERLGGFSQEKQLLEVYGITKEVANKVFEYFPFDPAIHRKLNINELEAAELSQHPYVQYGPAKVIIAYRKQHGNYKRPEDLLKIKIFNAEWLERLKPYLEF